MFEHDKDTAGADVGSQWTHPNSFYIYRKLETPLSFRLLKVERPSHRQQDGRGVFSLGSQRISPSHTCSARGTLDVEGSPELGDVPCYYSLIESTLDQAPHYEALSYVWGTSDRNETITLNDGKLLYITKPLKEALAFVERQCSTGYLWIDQICIDQDDMSERGHQVKLMGQIYTSCHRVLVWLGRVSKPDAELPPTEDLGGSQLPKDLLIPKVSSMGHMLRGLRKAHGPRRSSTESFWLELLQSTWYQRAWVFQEVVLPPSAMFILATTSTLPDQARMISLADLHAKVEGINEPNTAVDNICIMYARYIEQRRHTSHNYSPIEQTLSHLAPRAKTSEQLDRLYAFFGLNHDSFINLTPSYDSTLEVAMIDTATAIIEGTGSLDLFEVIPRAVENTKHKTQIPTWTPDFREDNLVAPFVRSKINFRQDLSARSELYPVFLPTHTTYYRTTWRGSIYCAGEEKRTILAHGFVLDHIETEIGTLSSLTATEIHLNALLDRCIKAWNRIKRHAEHKASSASRQKRESTGLAESTVDLGFAPEPTMTRLRRALVADHCCAASYDRLPSGPPDVADSKLAPEQAMVEVMRGRTLWITRSGRFALGSYLCWGDHICLAYGCSNPIALRFETTTHVLGTCYLEDWMDPWTNGSIERLEEKSAPIRFHIV
ncbi:HET-domain-containing protein [Paraphaeosphaeria sporulosa]|uniref:HET-domain-containing protein n=1 Tax=Paraphaeosphaeria sporulosa TaxID=1460663 RepID=A0A177C9Y7_9PLEO|nr:HET-domain-containing protein [Paraphaeosphaeria sporulosa]OAG04395.1 HET-domain-containing protein [Paraphaeosphaeria sporulosa]